MIEAGTVGAIFTIQDEASAVLLKIARQLNILAGAIDKIQASFATLGDVGMSKIQEQLGIADGKAVDLAKTLTGAADGLVAGLAKATEQLGRLDAAARTVGSGGPAGGSAHSGAGGALLSFVTDPVIDALIGGDIALKVGEAGANLAHQGVLMQAGGVTSSAADNATAIAMKLGDEYGFNATTVMKMLNEVRSPLNTGKTADDGLRAAEAIAPALLQTATVMRAVAGPEGAERVMSQIYGAIKTGEMRNLMSPGDYGHWLDSVGRIYLGTGGRVTPDDMLTAMKRAKASGMVMDEESATRFLPALIQEYGGALAGTMLASGYQEFVGGHITKAGKAEGARLGLYDANGNFKFAHDVATDPFKGYSEIGDALKAHGFVTDDQIAQEISKIAPNRNAAELLTKLILGAPQLQRAQAAINQTDPSIVANEKLNASDPGQAMAKVTAGLENLGAAFSGPFIPAIVSGLNGLAGVLKLFTPKAPVDKTALDFHANPHWFDPTVTATPAPVFKNRLGQPESTGWWPFGGSAAAPPPPPVVNVPAPSVQVDHQNMTVNLDGNQIAEYVAPLVVKVAMGEIKGDISAAVRAVSGANSFDQQRSVMPVDGTSTVGP